MFDFDNFNSDIAHTSLHKATHFLSSSCSEGFDGRIHPCLNSVIIHSGPGAPVNHLLRRLHLPRASIRGLTRRASGGSFTLVRTANSSPGPNSFLHFYGWIHHWKVIFPGALETMEPVKWHRRWFLCSARGIQIEQTEPVREKGLSIFFLWSVGQLACRSTVGFLGRLVCLCVRSNSCIPSSFYI